MWIEAIAYIKSVLSCHLYLIIIIYFILSSNRSPDIFINPVDYLFGTVRFRDFTFHCFVSCKKILPLTFLK